MAEKAQVGDLIRVVDAEPDSYDTYKDGDILEVIRRFEVGDGVEVKETDLNGDTMLLYDTEYVIHCKAGEEDASGRVYVKTIGEDDGRFITKAEYDAQFIDTTQDDAVDHPSHYTQGRFETIEIIEEVTQGYSDGYVAYCVGNALKYLARAPFKHESPAEDINKAAKYLAFASERLAKGER